MVTSRSAEQVESEVRHLTEQSRWLVRWRWIAVAGVTAAIALAHGLGELAAPFSLYAVGFVVGAYNIVFALSLRSPRKAASPATVQNFIFSQLALDLVALTFWAYFSGGSESPAEMFYLFHAIIGALLLSRSRALATAVFAVALHATTEFGLLGEPGIGSLELDSIFRFPALAHFAAFCVTLFGLAYFAASIASRMRAVDAERWARERLLMSRERMAHIGEISAGVAHAIRNPLHGVQNFVDVLQKKAPMDDASFVNVFSFIRDGLRRIETITRRLLVLARNESLGLRATDMNVLVEDALRFVDQRIAESGITLRKTLGTRAVAMIDQDRLNDALLCVLDNAVAACESGGTITVTTSSPMCETRLGVEELHARIEIADTGIGIPPEEAERVFEPFYTTKGVGEGTGLGLALTRRIVEDHGGVVSLESQVGKGTIVTLTLPLSQHETPEKQATI